MTTDERRNNRAKELHSDLCRLLDNSDMPKETGVGWRRTDRGGLILTIDYRAGDWEAET